MFFVLLGTGKFFKPLFSVIFVKMEAKIKKCKDCGKEFEQKAKSRYPRKYCDKCSAQRKKEWESVHLITADDCEEEWTIFAFDLTFLRKVTSFHKVSFSKKQWGI